MTMGSYLKIGEQNWPLGKRTGVFGILNVTPDSFSDGGRYDAFDAALAHAREMFAAGADVVDVGGESTRPGAEEVGLEEELDRVVRVVEVLAKESKDRIVSVDTSKAIVARESLRAGASIINDVFGFQRDPEIASVVAEYEASCVLMHNSRGGWLRNSVLGSVQAFWERSVEIAVKAGVSEDRIILDPGIGFTDTREQDLEMLRGLRELRRFGFPILLGASRKRVVGDPFGLPVDERLETSLATTALGIEAGVDFVRVHDVKENVRVAAMADLIVRR